MKRIYIVPIFNQRASFTWSTFAAIQSAAMLAIKYKTVPEEVALNIAQLNQMWDRFQPCFAFGAYDSGKMVGCVYGGLGSERAFINGLYVLPEYQKIGIGSRLLAVSEQAASVYTDRMELQAINNADTKKFYINHQYTIFDARQGLCAKNITGLWQNKTVPMFFCSDAVAHSCAKIAQKYNVNFDAVSVNSAHIPMFAYLDTRHGLQGYILAKSGTNEKDIQVSQMCVAEPYHRDIVRVLIENMAAMNIR